MSELHPYRVTVTLHIDAKHRRHAAMRAYSLLFDLTPDTYSVADAASLSKVVVLTEEEQKDALDMAFDGTLFGGN